MIKVRILTGMTAASAAAMALPSLAGCATTTDGQGGDPTTGAEQHDTQAVAGSGTLSLHSYSLDYASTSGGDEFLRVGEKLTVAVGFTDVLDKIAYPYDPGSAATRAALTADPTKLQVTAHLAYTAFDETKSTTDLPITWAPGAGGVLVGKTAELTIPAGTKALNLTMSASYDKAGTPTTTEFLHSSGIPGDYPVFGAFLPNKEALFDTSGADLRTRVVEGGGVLKGSQVLVSYTDWRLDTVTNKIGLDLRYGKQTSGSRFGPVIIDAVGALDYEVTANVSTDGGATYNPISLGKVSHPAALANPNTYQRFSHETEVAIAADAGPSVKIAFHVKAYLQVPNYYPGQVQDARYAPGQRVLLKDIWDNNGGQDYALPISSGD